MVVRMVARIAVMVAVMEVADIVVMEVVIEGVAILAMEHAMILVIILAVVDVHVKHIHNLIVYIMESEILFEHLVSNNLIKCQNIGANIFRACLSETKSYNNGFKVGGLYVYTKLALYNLKGKCNSKEYIKSIEQAIDELDFKNNYDDLCTILQKLNEKGIIF